MIRFARISSRFCSTTSKVREVGYNNLQQDNSSIIDHQKTNMPVEMKNPFMKEKRKCVLCQYKIRPTYKNVRLISQFVSRFTGKIYGRHITGLCAKQQTNLEIEAGKAIASGLMAAYYRDARYAHDPKLFDPDNPFRPHRF